MYGQLTSPVFPSIQTAYDNAKHLREEGKDLTDEYLIGDGDKQDLFVRETTAEVLPGLPGSLPGRVDATSMVISNSGHWLGGRLNVERALAEANAIWVEAEKIQASVPHQISLAQSPTPPKSQ